MSRTYEVCCSERNVGHALRIVWASALVVAACSGKSDHPGTLGPSDRTGAGGATGGSDAGIRGTGGRGGSIDGSAGSAGSSGDAGSAEGAPIVKVTSPLPLATPTAGTVLTSDSVQVFCSATRSSVAGATAVDAASVKIAALDANDQVVPPELPGTPTNNAGEYQASFVVKSVVNGVISFRCRASDTSSPAKTGSDEISTFIDHGPTVTVTTPAPDSAYALTGAVPFAFNVAPAPLAPGDSDANVTSVTLTVNGRTIPVVRDPSDPTGYKLSIDFNDTTVFPQPPTGMVPVEIRARDGRLPTPGERLNSYHFALDGAGPVVTLTKPKNQDIIGGKVTMEFTVVDALSGVDPKTVAVELNQVAKFYSPSDANWTRTETTGKYTYTFDSANISGSKVQVTANITASDVAGNHSAGESVVLYLDNKPPSIDLDPSNVRQLRPEPGGLQCSESFDPLGVAANDKDRVLPFTLFRALVWDETNEVAGQTVFYLSGTDQTSVYLFMQPDVTKPLLVDTDGDGLCDALNTSPNGVALPSLRLNPLMTPQGNAFFDTDDPNIEPTISDVGCTQAADPTPPPYLCMDKASDLTEVIRHNAANVEPVVYGIGGLMGLECTGTGWELPSQVTDPTQKEGWYCLAALAKDKVGNASISRPLRVCVDDPLTTGIVPSCTMNPNELPPSCTDGCTPPGRFPPTALNAHQ